MSVLDAEATMPPRVDFNDRAKIARMVARMTPEQRVALLKVAKPRMVDPYNVHIPHPKQQIFLGLKSREAMFGGAAGGGKSDSLLMAAMQYVDVPGYSALIVRRTWPDLSAPGAILDRANTWLLNSPAQKREGGRVWEFPTFDKDGKPAMPARLSFGTILRENDKYKFQCFTPETDILTTRGWVPVSDVTLDDMVASIDPRTKAMSYEPVSKTFAYDYEGEVVDVYQQNGVSFKVTPNHTVWAGSERNRILKPHRADELPMTSTIPQVFDWNGAPSTGKSFATRNTGGHAFTGDQWLKFLGWYISEGNCGSYGGRWEIKITQQKTDGWNELLDDLGAVAGLRWVSNEYVTLNNKALVEWLQTHTGTTAHFKRLPEEVFYLDPESANVLLRALVAGDGSTLGEDWWRFHTYSKQLAEDVMRLAVHAGWSPTLDIRDGGSYKDDSVAYIVHLSRRSRDTGLQSAKQQTDSSFWKMTPYKGKVYCVETPRFNTLVIRHRGRVSVSGNSAEYQFVGFDELTHFTESQYLYMFSRIRRPQLACLNCGIAVREYDSGYRHLSSSPNCPKLFPDQAVLNQYPEGRGNVSIFDVPLRMRSATNPGGTGHTWVRERFVNPKTSDKNAIFVPSTLADNPSLDQKSYEDSLNHLNSVDRQRLLDGDWDVVEDGTIFERHWFKIMEAAPDTRRVIRFWDGAATANGGDWTVGAKVRLTDDGRWVVEDIVRGQWSSAQKENIIRQVAASDGPHVPIRIEQEPGSAGVDVIDGYRRRVLVGYNFDGVRPTGSKEDRAYTWAAAAEVGNVYLVAGQWNRTFLDEAAQFPNGAHDDQIDAISGGVNFLAHGRSARVLV